MEKVHKVADKVQEVPWGDIVEALGRSLKFNVDILYCEMHLHDTLAKSFMRGVYHCDLTFFVGCLDHLHLLCKAFRKNI
jgi:hypothetical protein